MIEEREAPEQDEQQSQEPADDGPDASELDQEPDYNPDPESGPGKLKGG